MTLELDSMLSNKDHKVYQVNYYNGSNITLEERSQLLQQFHLRLVDPKSQNLATEIFNIKDQVEVYRKRIHLLPFTPLTRSGSVSRSDKNFLLEVLDSFLKDYEISRYEKRKTLEILQIIDSEGVWHLF
ncbi:MAG: hypothetical protein SFU25_05395 [Candidatus Caenarcaniphilales bacterium]|nr:hypothetical protein [Candidatus Caenarcaniphilales bacterium]